ncbi:phage tape measure protein [uncultured Mediterranean phage uvMED]|nr:phage tape measure protein [uncultured Mediterranean phage uvMED]BAR24984.1 phage tape measure protein [uncultured Mediterranean phage uvMED]BAR25066.1 phage tape measure protein [uncultured Mediterranean phage uvMED]BAR25134.1 phage tape measure protein [uncultured Mediterranean phage uvMED]BAR25170.1 phage tape measure protein [uncultured Mediterranean phage uvMED]
MARSSVELIVDAVKALNPLRAVAAASKKTEKAIEGLKKSAKATGKTLEDMARRGKKGLSALAARAKTAAGSFSKLGKAALLAGAAAGAAALAKFSFGQAGELERQTKSLQVLTGSLETAKGIISELQAFGAVTPFTSQELIETSKRLKAFGFETNQVVDITKRLADVAGATGADLGGIATAFGQIQAKGRLQGEELLQLQERGVALQDELRKMYGLTGEEFSKALQKGQISAKAAEVALIRLTEKGGKYANGAIAQSDTLFGKLSTLQDAFQRFGQNIGNALAPVFKSIIEFLTTITNQINNLFREAALENQARKNLGLDKMGSTRKFFKEGGRSLLDAEKERLREKGFGLEPVMPDTKIPELRNAQVDKQLNGVKKLEDRKGKLFKMEADHIMEMLELEEQRNFDEGAALGKSLQAGADLIEQADRRAELIKARVDGTQSEVRLKNKIADINKMDLEPADKAALIAKEQSLHLLKEQIKAGAALGQVYESIGQSISTGIVDALSAAVEGTKSLADVASQTLRQVANILLQFGVNTALGGLSTVGGTGSIFNKLFGGFAASGGTVSGGRSYVVGEKGPELFTPGRTGSIAPSGSFGGANVVVNVDASGSQAQGSQPNAKALGAAIGAAVQAELVKQKRPGGLLS